VSTTGGRTVALIGGYADPSRIVLVFRTLPDAGTPQVQVSDDKGPINAAYFGAQGAAGDQIIGLQQGPHVAAGGVAHLAITVSGFAQFGALSTSPGSWTFSVPLPVQLATALPLTPKLTAVGTWKIDVEAFELTPSVIHLRALVDGTAPAGISDSTAVLMGPDGGPVKPMTLEAANVSGQTLLNETWVRPAVSATYQLRVSGGGGQYAATVAIPAPPAPNSGKGTGQPVTPLSFPEASESLVFQGAIDEHIATGRPQSCGAGSGPDGLLIYAFATYFQSKGAWYYVTFWTDKTVQQFNGLGIYTAQAYLSPVATMGGTDPMFTGSVQLAVTSQGGNKFGGLQTGSVSGSLAWTDDLQQKLTISGTWSCRFSAELGPA
jgi:hypothetical protein